MTAIKLITIEKLLHTGEKNIRQTSSCARKWINPFSSEYLFSHYNTPMPFNYNYFMPTLSSPFQSITSYNFFPNFNIMPIFNHFSSYNFMPAISNIKNYPILKPIKKTVERVFSTSTSIPANLSKTLAGYNATKGSNLAQTAWKKAPKKWTGYCALHVVNAMKASGIKKIEYGHAFQLKNILRRNPEFKEIDPRSVNVKNLPAGCIIVFDKGAKGYSRSYGHVEITDGKGHGISDGITHHLQQPSAIFMPV